MARQERAGAMRPYATQRGETQDAAEGSRRAAEIVRSPAPA
jgi:hypothetical protein